MQTYPVSRGVPGFTFSAVLAGIKKKTGLDLGLILSQGPCPAAGVFTRNSVKAAPVLTCASKLRRGVARAVIVNSGNANACTGDQGLRSAGLTCEALAQLLQIDFKHVLPCSTGVIGVPLPHETIIRALPALISGAAPSRAPAFARSILTTDTRPKSIALQATINGRSVHMLGMAKGSGMIMPDMATMLAFIVTDAAVDTKLLAALLREEAELSFNRICVDGDMSTNDTVLVMAGGASGVSVTATSRSLQPFRAMLRRVMQELALMIVKDGEGATKLLRVAVSGARTEADAKKAALQVARSCLVKTAFFGEDFNWGRIIAAVGQSGAHCKPGRIAMHFNDIPAVHNGQAVPENRARLVRVMKKKDITLAIDLACGSKTCDVLTCDLSYEYIKINADYTT